MRRISFDADNDVAIVDVRAEVATELETAV